MQRVKNVGYDDDDLYSDDDAYEEEGGDEQGTKAEDRENFAALTPVVRAELAEAGVQVDDGDIEKALWHYYWNVGKSVAYLKNSRTPRTAQPQVKKEKPKSKFDEAAHKSAAKASKLNSHPSTSQDAMMEDSGMYETREHAMSANEWFKDTPWTGLDPDTIGQLVSTSPEVPRSRLLGGSSKLAKLAEERRRKAATSQTPQPAPVDSLNSLDRLTISKESKENTLPVETSGPKKYPTRRKRSPTPPPREPTPPPEETPEQLPDLRSSPTAFGQTLSKSSGQLRTATKMALQDILGSKSAKSDLSTKNLAAKTEALKVDDAPPGPPQSKVRSKGHDVPKLWEEEKTTRKSTAGFVVVGHVDHGKSTLMGRLLLDTGGVSQREVDKFKKQATDIGKPSFALAWVMDTGSEERERGVTVDIAQHHFSTDKIDFTILDAPGHRDFVPNMIGGASMADLAVLVVDANQLESGMKGQTKEHILLAHAVGLRRIVVAVNKLDSTNPAWSEEQFDTVRAAVLELLTETGFSAENIAFVPCSGLGGENVVSSPDKIPAASWTIKSHQTLLKQLETSIPPTVSLENVKKPLRMQISDVFRGGVTNPLSISGLVRQGSAQVGDIIVAQPSGETATIKGIEVAGETRPWTVAGEIPTLHLVDIEPQHLRSGDIVCTALKPVQVVKKLTVRVEAMDSLLPQSTDVHIGRMHVSGTINQLVATVNDKDELLKKKPRMVKAGQKAVLKLTLVDAVPIESGDRVVLRAAGSTIAAGVVQSVDAR